MGIEHLLFEELVISTGFGLSREDYERCLKVRKSFTKLIRQLSPDHQKLQEFTRAITEIELGAPTLVYWQPKDLEKAWGNLSKHLHWSGAGTETTEDPKCLEHAYRDVKDVLVPIWSKMSPGARGLMQPDDMKPQVRAIWEEFRNGSINAGSVKIRLELIRPLCV